MYSHCSLGLSTGSADRAILFWVSLLIFTLSLPTLLGVILRPFPTILYLTPGSTYQGGVVYSIGFLSFPNYNVKIVYIHKGLNGWCTDSTAVGLHYATSCHKWMFAVATSIGVSMTDWSWVGCCERVSGLASGVHGNWVRDVHWCYGTWHHRLLTKLKEEVPGPTLLHTDNWVANLLMQNPVNHSATKHINMQYHFIWECITDRSINLKLISMKDMVANILTKSLAHIMSQLCNLDMETHP